MCVRSRACAAFKRLGMQRCAETVLSCNLRDGLARLDERVDREHGRVRRENEFELSGAGLGVELLDFDAGFVEAGCDFGEEGEV